MEARVERADVLAEPMREPLGEALTIKPRSGFVVVNRLSRIAHYKIPVHVSFVESFPMTVTGKVQKFLIRKAMIERLEVTEERTA